jgi:hypothetical protein
MLIALKIQQIALGRVAMSPLRKNVTMLLTTYSGSSNYPPLLVILMSEAMTTTSTRWRKIRKHTE